LLAAKHKDISNVLTVLLGDPEVCHVREVVLDALLQELVDHAHEENNFDLKE
jgi:hypothetical protein